MKNELRTAFTWLLAGALLPLAASADTSGREYHFSVYLDGKRIGDHRYQITGLPGSERVRSEASFEFKLLFVTLYRYQHVANEAWRDGCLTDLDAVTNDNGRDYRVSSDQRQSYLLLTRLEPDRESREIADCPASFAYWDLQRMKADALINAQNGEVLRTRLVREGRERLADREVVRYRLEAEGLSPIDLWYRAEDDAWVGLATRRDGRLLEYRLESAPPRQPSVADDARVEDAVGV
ncbi:MAG: DUF6134 family protein [Pseudomonadales bacterium]